MWNGRKNLIRPDHQYVIQKSGYKEFYKKKNIAREHFFFAKRKGKRNSMFDCVVVDCVLFIHKFK